MSDTLRAILFDLDGTLADTAPDLGAAADLVRAARGLPPLPLASYRPVASAGARGLLRIALQVGEDDPHWPELRTLFLDAYRARLCASTRLFDGISAVLDLLEDRGLAWGIVTNKPQDLTDPLIHALGLDRRSSCTIGAREDLAPKPAPDALTLAADTLATAPASCAYVGDDHRDMDAARAAGMTALAADWGYRAPDDDINGWGADAVLADPFALSDWISARLP